MQRREWRGTTGALALLIDTFLPKVSAAPQKRHPEHRKCVCKPQLVNNIRIDNEKEDEIGTVGSQMRVKLIRLFKLAVKLGVVLLQLLTDKYRSNPLPRTRREMSERY